MNPSDNTPPDTAAGQPAPDFRDFFRHFDDSQYSYRGEYPAAGKSFDIDGVPHVLVPDNCKLQDLEARCATPSRVRAKLQLLDLAGWLAYVGGHQTEATEIFAHVHAAGMTATAIFDYPASAEHPAWGDHRATYQTTNAPEWLDWMGKNNALFSQLGFAEFVEDNQRHFVEPSAAEMLALAQRVEMTSSAAFTGAVKLADGDTELAYTSEKKAVGRGALAFPPGITLALAPFVGAIRREVNARLRPSVNNEGRLTIRYKLMQPHLVIEEATDAIRATITSATGKTLLIGTTPERV